MSKAKLWVAQGKLMWEPPRAPGIWNLDVFFAKFFGPLRKNRWRSWKKGTEPENAMPSNLQKLRHHRLKKALLRHKSLEVPSMLELSVDSILFEKTWALSQSFLRSKPLFCPLSFFIPPLFDFSQSPCTGKRKRSFGVRREESSWQKRHKSPLKVSDS